MLKFIRGKGHQLSAERQKLQTELFSFKKTVQHGFPNKPTCLAWDPALRIMGIGTSSGAIKVLGKPGVEFYGQHCSIDVPVTKMIFIPNQGRLVTLLDDNSLHLWEINEDLLEEVKSLSFEGKLKKISALCLDGGNEHLLLGTEGGNVYLIKLPSFEILDTIIYQDVVMQNVPEDYKINPGAVEAMAIQPDRPENLLIGYNRGLMVLWNMKNPSAEQTYISTQGVESVCWSELSPGRFYSSHNDGSYTIWDVNSPDPAQPPTTVYGPFPCKAITKIAATASQNREEMLVFCGGMQRATYSDRHTISALDDSRHIAFEFTSKAVDFFIATSGTHKVLVVLAEEELIGLDLTTENWPMLQLPYLVSLHASAITCSTYVSDVPAPLWESIVEAGKQQSTGVFSPAAWPVDGGEILDDDTEKERRRDLLLTGHEDGSVRLWDAGSVTMTPLASFHSNQVLQSSDDDLPPLDQSQDAQEDEFPPFKKVGSFDPYSDDPRLAVKKVSLCPETGTLAVAGTAGHVLIAKLGSEKISFEPKVTLMNIVSSRDGFVWKGHEQLGVRPGSVEVGPGFQVSAVLQLHPPAAVTALALHSGWGLVAAGTAHGMALFDYVRHAQVAIKCTLNPSDLSTSAGDAPISRRKSFKKSLRESFRRLRKGRSTRGGGTTTAAAAKRATTPAGASGPATAGDEETKPVERAVEARSVDDGLGSMLRALTFARTYIISVQNMTPTLWAGTNNGTVYVFTLAVPGGSKRMEESVSCQLGKEIQLKHRAPVIGISLMDGLANSVDTSRTEEHPPPHKVIIASEEQIKIFSVPALKPVCKLKLTAGEGARVRRTCLASFSSAKGYRETCLCCLTNLGDIMVLNLPELRRQVKASVIRREDINGISSLAFTDDGEAVYLHSSSELQRITLSTTRLTVAHCCLDIPPDARPARDTDDDTTSISSSESSSSSSSNSSHHSDASQKKEEKKPKKPSDEGTKSETHHKGEIKENGVSETTSAHDVTLSSVDITIDSVKDHLTNNVSNSSIDDNSTIKSLSSEFVRNESTKIESSETATRVIKTTIITSNNSSANPVEAETETQVSVQQTSISEVRKAPLARMEDMETDHHPVTSV